MAFQNENQPASPIELNGFGQYAPEAFLGLTKREHFAWLAMQAWIQHHGSSGSYGFSEKTCAETALQCADALLEELSKGIE